MKSFEQYRSFEAHVCPCSKSPA